MMRAIITVALALTMSNAFAVRTVEVLEEAYELMLGDIVMPSGAAGTAVFRPCAECDSVGMAVSAQTRYFFGGREATLPEFLRLVEELRQTPRGNAEAFVGLFYDQQANRITRLTVSP